jgi:hypothetical protein
MRCDWPEWYRRGIVIRLAQALILLSQTQQKPEPSPSPPKPSPMPQDPPPTVRAYFSPPCSPPR